MAFFRDPGEMFLGCLGTVEQRYLVTGSPMAAFINEQLKDQLTDLNKFVEMYCEGGAIAVKPFVTNIDENGRPTAIELDFVKAVDFFPCAFNNK